MTDLQKTYPYSITLFQVAALNLSTESYGTPASFDKVQGFEPDPQVDEDSIKAAGAVERYLSVLTEYEWSVGNASIQAPVLSILDATSNYLSGLTPNQVRTLDVYGGISSPYFGAIAHLPLDEGGVALWGFPFSKVMTRIGFEIEQNQFAIPEVTGKAGRWRMADGTLLPIVRISEHETDPGPVTDFDAFFGIA